MEQKNYFLVKTLPIHGKTHRVIKNEAFNYIRAIEQRSKRKPYIKSRYFKTKIFISVFLSHLFEKKPAERTQRMKLIPCAIELIEKGTSHPTLKSINTERYYRFFGKTTLDQKFVVQIKENNRNRKYLISVYPEK